MPSPHSSTVRTTEVLRRVYRTLAPLYDTLVPYVSSTARSQGLCWLDVRDGERVLDVGTGTGLALPHLVTANPTGWTEGVDLTPAMLGRARRRMAPVSHDRYGLREANVASLPYPSATFDAVFAGYVIDVLPRPQIRPALHEIHRVLRPRGRLVLIYLTVPQRPAERVWSLLAHSLPLLFGGARPVRLRDSLYVCDFEVANHTSHTQVGLRSAITRATPT